MSKRGITYRSGYYSAWITSGLATSVVHKVIVRWTKKIGPHAVERHAIDLAHMVRDNREIRFCAASAHRAFCIELLGALDKLYLKKEYAFERNLIWRLNMWSSGGQKHNLPRHVDELSSWKVLAAELGDFGVVASHGKVRLEVTRQSDREKWFYKRFQGVHKIAKGVHPQ